MSALLGGVMLLAGCDAVAQLPPNPFRTTPTLLADAPKPTPTPTVQGTPTPVPFQPFWVRNHRKTEMWSGQAGQPNVISFGTTSSQFCLFLVLQPQSGPRLFVENPYGQGDFWIDGDAVGPVSEEPRKVPGPKPDGVNCTDVLYTEP
ncbi:MAG: hypothetical protein AB7P40_13975 [Chloroflexota bacterium]